MSPWRRLGRLDLDTGGAAWAATHAALPVLEPDGDDWRVYLSLRDAEGRARIGRTRLVMRPTPALGPLERDPALDLGPLGAFDHSGVTTSSLVIDGARRWLFYTGWSRGVTVPFYLAAGLAVSTDGGPFQRLSNAPLLDRTPVDPFLTASPFVRLDEDRWRMWYVSATGWTVHAGAPRHHYHIRYADGDDAVTWRRKGHVCIDFESEAEYAFARPHVVRDTDRYRMWYAVRGNRYRIGYAESPDGMVWTRQDGGGLEPSREGWDSDMVEYPCVFDWRGTRYMLYNGNDYGRTGVGLAVWDAAPPPVPGTA